MFLRIVLVLFFLQTGVSSGFCQTAEKDLKPIATNSSQEQAKSEQDMPEQALNTNVETKSIKKLDSKLEELDNKINVQNATLQKALKDNRALKEKTEKLENNLKNSQKDKELIQKDKEASQKAADESDDIYNTSTLLTITITILIALITIAVSVSIYAVHFTIKHQNTKK